MFAALILSIIACRDAESTSDSAAPAILPVFAQQTSNADATIPKIPFSAATPVRLARSIRRWPHDSMAYTQGFLVHGDRLLESTGLEGRSDLREVDRVSGRVLRSSRLGPKEFGEGIAAVGDKVYQLTWKSGRGHVYDARTLAPIDSFTYQGEGWGLTSDGTRLYLSDGSSRIRVIDPNGFRPLRTIQVTEAGNPVYMLNELEWVRGELWANVYETEMIARIDPATGHVVGWVDLSRVLSAAERGRVSARGGVANGIAFDSAGARVFVTGKYWHYVVQLDSVLIPTAAESR
jgi:glutamine cyclotransferase